MLHSNQPNLTTHTGSLPRPACSDSPVRPARRRRSGRPAAIEGKEKLRPAMSCEQLPPASMSEQWRAAAGGVFPLRPSPHDRLRRHLDGWVTRRGHTTLSPVPGPGAAAADGLGPRSATRGHASLWPPARLPRSTPVRWEAECDEFQAALSEIGRPGFAEPFMTAPSPGIIAAAMRNEHYDTEDAYLAALGGGWVLHVEYEAIVW